MRTSRGLDTEGRLPGSGVFEASSECRQKRAVIDASNAPVIVREHDALPVGQVDKGTRGRPSQWAPLHLPT